MNTAPEVGVYLFLFKSYPKAITMIEKGCESSGGFMYLRGIIPDIWFRRKSMRIWLTLE